jgi:hypothetical protein
MASGKDEKFCGLSILNSASESIVIGDDPLLNNKA